MRTSQYLLSTLKETPADAEVISHQLMLRAGMIRKLASGLYTWLPTGVRVLKKVENIVREEMNNAGAIEVSMPVVQPADLWQESGRWEQYGPELLRFVDRGERPFVLGPTHEEVITDLIRNELSSYKQLPLNFFQIQTKFRDEVRPRFGVMRSREFLMKDAYSFHTSQESLQETYDAMYAAYSKIFSRMGLDFRAVQADTGSIGGSASHEFQVLAQSGEDDVIFSDSSDYAANIEFAEALAPKEPRGADQPELRVPADIIIVAIGQGIETHGFEQSGIKIQRGGTILADSGTHLPDMEGVFAGGDCVTGPATVIRAIAAGKVAAANIDEYLGYCHTIEAEVEIPAPHLSDFTPRGRVSTTEREAGARKMDFQCIECGMTLEEAQRESARCLRCDHFGYGVFKGGREEKW